MAQNPSSLSYKHWQRLSRYFYLRMRRGHPNRIARGLAVGVFAGMLPMFGLQTITALVLAFVVRGHKVMAVLGTWVSNPLTDIPIHLFNFRVGQWLLGTENLSFQNLNSWQTLLQKGQTVVITWMAGGITIGLVSGLGSYYLGLRLAKHLQNRQRSRKKAQVNPAKTSRRLWRKN